MEKIQKLLVSHFIDVEIESISKEVSQSLISSFAEIKKKCEKILPWSGGKVMRVSARDMAHG